MGHTLVACSGEVNLKNEFNEWGLTLNHSIFSKNFALKLLWMWKHPKHLRYGNLKIQNASFIPIGCICFRTHSVFPASWRKGPYANIQSVIILCHLSWHLEICMVREYEHMLMSSLNIVNYSAHKLVLGPCRNTYTEDIYWIFFLFVASFITYYLSFKQDRYHPTSVHSLLMTYYL